MTRKTVESLGYLVAPEDQGQAVEVGYADTGTAIVCRTLDRGDGSTSYRYARWSDVWDAIEPGSRRARKLEEWCVANGPPPIPEECWQRVES